MTSRLAYIVGSEAWYHETATRPHWAREHITEEISVQRQALNDAGRDDGVRWEFMIRWYDLSGAMGRRAGTDEHPRIEMFDDAWTALTDVPELFDDLQATTERDSVIPADVIHVLVGRGFVDITDRTSPYAPLDHGV